MDRFFFLTLILHFHAFNNFPFFLNQLAECSVTVLITNMDSNIIAMDTCLVKWMANEWSAVRTVTISAKSGFVDDSQITVTLVTNPANSSSSYYNGYNPPDITLQTAPRRSSQCVAWGDPHYTVCIVGRVGVG